MKWTQFAQMLCAAGFVFAVALSLISQSKTIAASTGNNAGARIVPPPAAYMFPTEKYVFSVQWRFLNAGTSTVSIQRTGTSEHLTATAESSGLPDKIFRVHDIFDADVSPRTFCTSSISKHNEEGPHRRESKIVMDYARAKSEVDVKDLKTSQSKHESYDIPPCVTDVVSGFFYVASLPLAPGLAETFPVNDNGKTTEVSIRVEGREKIKAPPGEFQTLRVMAEPLSGPMKGKGVLSVWFTDDARRIPVQMKSKLGFATLFFQLQKIEPPTPPGK